MTLDTQGYFNCLKSYLSIWMQKAGISSVITQFAITAMPT